MQLRFNRAEPGILILCLWPSREYIFSTVVSVILSSALVYTPVSLTAQSSARYRANGVTVCPTYLQDFLGPTPEERKEKCG